MKEGIMMNEIKKLQANIFKWVILLFTISSVLTLVFINDPKRFIIGLLFGTLISALNFIELSKTIEKAVTMDPAKAQLFSSLRYFVRFIITGVVLFVSIKASYINVLGTIVGLLLIKLVILITNLLNNKEYYKNIFRKEG
ncbi:ATP synthase subunit I [Helicovermis profundi]